MAQSSPKRGRGPGRPFEKGKSGNPGGRHKIPEEVKTMLKAATVDAARLLIDTVNNKDARIDIRIDAAKAVLDRVYGKPTQPIDGDLSSTFDISIKVIE